MGSSVLSHKGGYSGPLKSNVYSESNEGLTKEKLAEFERRLILNRMQEQNGVQENSPHKWLSEFFQSRAFIHCTDQSVELIKKYFFSLMDEDQKGSKGIQAADDILENGLQKNEPSDEDYDLIAKLESLRHSEN